MINIKIIILLLLFIIIETIAMRNTSAICSKCPPLCYLLDRFSCNQLVHLVANILPSKIAIIVRCDGKNKGVTTEILEQI